MTNPFAISGLPRFKFAYELLPDFESMLDVGCGDATFIGALQKSQTLHGCEVNKDMITSVSKKYPHVEFKEIEHNKKLPYKKNSMDVITALEVLEHVPDREEFARDVCRILKKGGVLIMSAPHKGPTGWIDWGNLKYKTPAIHRFIVKTFKGSEYYKKKYASNYYGDMSPGLTEHHHFTIDEIKELLEKYFVIESVRTYGLLTPFLLPIRDLTTYLFGHQSKLMLKLIHKDAEVFQNRIGYSVIIKAMKK